MQQRLTDRLGVVMPVLIGLVLVACSGSAPTVSPTPLPTTAPVANAAQAGAAAFALTTSARATEASSRATEVTGHAFETATAVGATRVVASTATADAYAASVANRYATATAVIAAQQVGLTATAQVISAARTATAMPTPTPVLPPGMSLVNGQPEDVADFLPSNPGLIRLLMMRDAPELITDDVLIAFNTFQVRAEQAAWHELDETMQRERETENQPRDPGCTNPVGCLKWNLKPFTFEWQKRIEQQPDLAQGALMDAFIRPDADWSFVTKEPGWDDTRSNAVALFVFSRESVEGRDPQFAARELVPVMRRFVSAAVKRTPTRFWMNLPLPRAVWDFQTSSFQFYDPNATIGGKFLDKVDVLAARTNPNELADFPEAVRPLANYNLGAQSTSDPRLSAHVGSGLLGAPTAVVASSPAWVNIVSGYWLVGNTSNILSLDRALQIAPLRMDAARAESLTKKYPSIAFIARVYISIDHVLPFKQPTIAPRPDMPAAATTRFALQAHVDRLDVLATAAADGPPPPADAPKDLVVTFN